MDDDTDEVGDGDMDDELDMDEEAELADDVFNSVGFSGTGLSLLTFDDAAPPFFLCNSPS